MLIHFLAIGGVRRFTEFYHAEGAMRSPISFLLSILCSSLLATAPAGAQAGAPCDLAEIVDQAFLNIYGQRYAQTLEMVTLSSLGREQNRRLVQVVRSEQAEQNRAMIRFLEPPSLAGTSILFFADDEAVATVFVHLPALSVTRQISGANTDDAFFGTALTFSDFYPLRADDFDIEREASIDTSSCSGIRLVDRTPSPYDRIDICVSLDGAVVHRMEFFEKGALRKRLLPDLASNRRIGDRTLPFSFEVEDLASGVRTQVATTFYEEAPEIPRALFTASNLDRGSAKGDLRMLSRAREDGHR